MLTCLRRRPDEAGSGEVSPRHEIREASLMRLLVLYQSDLAPASTVSPSPGGINSVVRGDLARFPASWDVEVWGVGPAGAVHTPGAQMMRIGDREVRFRPLVTAGSVEGRHIPLAPRYSVALATEAARQRLRRSSYDAVLAHRTEYLAALGWLRPLRRLPPTLAFIHGSSAWSVSAMGRVRGWGQLAGESIAVRLADAVALVSKSTLPYYQKRYPSHASRFHWIPNGIDVTPFTSGNGIAWRTRNRFAPDDRLLVYHGRYIPEKGLRRMLDAFRVLQADGPWHLVCAGGGPLRNELGAAAATWGAGRIHDVGFLAPPDLPDLLAAGDVGMLLSDMEGFSMALLESLAAGLPVVATPVGDNPVVLSELAPELLVDDASPERIAERVRWAWEYRPSLSRRGRDVAAKYSIDARVRQLAELITTIMHRPCV